MLLTLADPLVDAREAERNIMAEFLCERTSACSLGRNIYLYAFSQLDSFTAEPLARM